MKFLTMALNAVERSHDDPTMRITNLQTDFQLELSPGDLRILTVGVLEGFSVSFSFTEELSEEIGALTSRERASARNPTDPKLQPAMGSAVIAQ